MCVSDMTLVYYTSCTGSLNFAIVLWTYPRNNRNKKHEITNIKLCGERKTTQNILLLGLYAEQKR